MNKQAVAQELVKVAKLLTGGATDFYTFGEGRNAEKAFKKLVKEAKYNHGHGYTGTIGEKTEFKMVGTAKTAKEAFTMAHSQVNSTDKWGPAFCIEVESPKGFVFFGMASL